MQSEYVMDALDTKLNEAFDGKVVRKDLLHRIKKGTNVPTFVLEFLLARYCASKRSRGDPGEGLEGGFSRPCRRTTSAPTRPTQRNRAWRSRASTSSSTKCMSVTLKKRNAALGVA